MIDQLLRAISPRGTSFKRLQTDWRKAKGPGQIAILREYCEKDHSLGFATRISPRPNFARAVA